MSRSPLLQLARDSIAEVLEAKNIIDKKKIIGAYGVLEEVVPTEIELFIQDELHGSFSSTKLCVFDAITIGAKKAAFESSKPLHVTTYLHATIKITLQTPQGSISHQDQPLIQDTGESSS